MLAGSLTQSACLEVQEPCIAVSALQAAGAVSGRSCVLLLMGVQELCVQATWASHATCLPSYS